MFEFILIPPLIPALNSPLLAAQPTCIGHAGIRRYMIREVVWRETGDFGTESFGIAIPCPR
jgi:hypothetical protein